MKTSYQLIRASVFLFAILFTGSCSNHDDNSRIGKIQFSLGRSASGGRVDSVETPIAVMIEYFSSQGTKNMTIPLYEFGGEIASAAIEIPTGYYALEKFFVLGANNKVLYAAPLLESELAKFVNKPLPIPFTVGENEITRLDVEVLPVDDTHGPRNFGYAVFSFTVVQPNVKVIKLKATVNAVGDPENILKGNVKIGDAMTGEILYDVTQKANWVEPNVKTYLYKSSPNRIEFNVNTYSFKTDPANRELLLAVHNDLPTTDLSGKTVIIDYIDYNCRQNISNLPTEISALKIYLGFVLVTGPSAISNTNIPLSLNLSDWTNRNLIIDVRKPNGDSAYYIYGTITEMN